jgi:hypothetical protein
LDQATHGALNEIKRRERRVSLVLTRKNATGVEQAKVEQLPELA